MIKNPLKNSGKMFKNRLIWVVGIRFNIWSALFKLKLIDTSFIFRKYKTWGAEAGSSKLGCYSLKFWDWNYCPPLPPGVLSAPLEWTYLKFIQSQLFKLGWEISGFWSKRGPEQEELNPSQGNWTNHIQRYYRNQELWSNPKLQHS